MSEIIFHQYAMSPFSEKVRKIFALKDIAYRSVDQPAWMPKPHLTPLTGGYRRIPVLQIGADIYCDSVLIIRKLDELAPEPSIYPDGNALAAEGLAAWADKHLFLAAVPLVFLAMADVMPKELFEDRRRMFPQLSLEALKAAEPGARGTMRSHLAMLEDCLSSRPFLLGPQFSVADAAVFHCLWFARNDPRFADQLQAFTSLQSWFSRVEGMGQGRGEAMDPDAALEAAGSKEPLTRPHSDPLDPNGLEPGIELSISAEDLPADKFKGVLLSASEHEVVIMREDPQLGRLAVHFPRAGYLLHLEA